MTGLIEPHYLPSLEYFCAIRAFDHLILEKSQHYVKQSYRNRCYINTGQGVQRLVVPLAGKHNQVRFGDIQIDSSNKWRNIHWRTIQSAYAKAPFFEHYSEEVSKLVYTPFEFLFDLNASLLSLCLRNMGMQKSISATVTYEKEVPGDVFDLRSRINRREEGSGSTFYQPQRYYQVFGNSFAGNLSVIDLLFCEGPESVRILEASSKNYLNK